MKIEPLSLINTYVRGENDLFRVKTQLVNEGDGIDYLKIEIEGTKKVLPPEISIVLTYPSVSLYGTWKPAGGDMEDGYNRTLGVNWSEDYGRKISNTLSAPIACLYDAEGNNRLTIAYSDILEPIYLKTAIQEDTVELNVTLTLFKNSTQHFDFYTQQVRLDTRNIIYSKALKEVAEWWEMASNLRYSEVPEAARKPMYSTWYSFHQEFTDQDIEKQCRLAKEYGCETIIVDDGWQLSGADYGYSHTGDWEIAKEKFKDMVEHVRVVHNIGLKYMLWFSVPFIGVKSKLWNKMKDKILYTWESKGAGILDPRYLEVRNLIIEQYEKVVTKWDIDGLKLDFVDYFNLGEDVLVTYGDGRDYDNISLAVDALLAEVIIRLKFIKPDIMIEFRQPYCGPLMQKYGNMLRAWDCVNDSLENRIRTIDIRLISKSAAIHSDMIIWNKEDSVECAALQLVNVLFSVPQISVKLENLSPSHRQMLKFWMDFFLKHYTLLQYGELCPLAPHLLYPVISSEYGQDTIIAVYDERVIKLGLEKFENIYIVNGKLTNDIVADIEVTSIYKCIVYTCQGVINSTKIIELQKGLYKFNVPPAGLIELIIQ